VDTQRSTERVPPEFAQLAREVRSLARILKDYLRETDIDVPGTVAAREFALEPSFANEEIPNPVTHVILRCQQALIPAADHMLGIAACIEAEDVVLATLSLIRPIVTASGIAYYLVDPELSLRERLRRGWNIELDSFREQLNSLVDAQPEPWQAIVDARTHCLTWGTTHEFGQKSRHERFGVIRYWLTDGEAVTPPPTEMKLAEDVLAAVGGAGMGKMTYRFASAFIHTQSHALTMFRPAEMHYDSQTPNVVPLGVGLSDFATWLTIAVMAVDGAAVRCGRYFGWDLSAWSSTARALLNKWATA
jgi:hypothetical protein